MQLTAMAVRWQLRKILLNAQVDDPSKTVAALAVATGVSRQQASSWVNSSDVPTMRDASTKLGAICDFLSCRVSDLIVEDCEN
jgi:DNA-binding Xre family transcriptional regulator